MQIIEQKNISPSLLIHAKEYLRINGSLEDALLESMISSSIDWVESDLGQTLFTKTFRATAVVDSTPLFKVQLKRPPIQEILFIEGVKNNACNVIFTDYVLSGDELCIKNTKNTHSLTIEYKAGYGDNFIDIPKDISQALFLGTHILYNGRSNSMDAQRELMATLLKPYRSRRL